mgnify:CR=1 FL=1
MCICVHIYIYMKNDNYKSSPEHKAMAEAAIGVLDTRFLKALTDPTRVQIVKKLILFGVCDVSTIAKGLSQDRSVVSRHLAPDRAEPCRSIGLRFSYNPQSC